VKDVEVKMPDLATTESQMKIIGWLIQPGQSVRRGQGLLEIETDKATMEVEATVTGTLKSIVVPADQSAEVGQVIAIIEVEES
jgi:pyruvate dehydrogenase E2 component (dihydrolipoamide acetyltransferase)